VANKKFYAVKKGRSIGIFNSWNECKASIEGYSGAEYKGFSSLVEAEAYLKIEHIQTDNRAPVNDEIQNLNEDMENGDFRTIKAYVDGSFSEESGVYSFGCVIITPEKIERLSGSGKDESATLMRNVAGELLGAMKAIKWAYENKYKKMIIYHDYEGIAKWITGEWKAKQDGTKSYVDFVMKYKKFIDVDFIKVLAHSGDQYNEEADKLAKEALLQRSQTQLIDNKTNSAENDNLKLFKKVMRSKSSSKNQFYIKFGQYEISESKLTKFIKELWKFEGKDTNNIDSMKVWVDTHYCNISWMVLDKSGMEHSGELKLN
jgi:ribonuclease HI